MKKGLSINSLKKSLLLGSMAILFSTASYSFPQLQQMQQRAEKAEAAAQTYLGRAQVAEEKLVGEKAKTQRAEEEFREQKTRAEHAENQIRELQARIREREQLHGQNDEILRQLREQLAQHQQHLNQCQNELQEARAQVGQGGQGGEGGQEGVNVQQLQDELQRLRQRLAEVQPEAVAQEINLPAYDNPANFIHQAAQIHGIDPQVQLNMDNALQTARDRIADLLNDPHGDSVNSLVIPRGGILVKRMLKRSLQELADSIQVGNPMDWETFDRIRVQIDQGSNNFDKIPGNNATFTALKQALETIQQNRPAVQRAEEANRFNANQQNILNLHQNATQPLDALADNFLNVHMPALIGMSNDNRIPGGARDKIKEIVNFIRDGRFDELNKQLNTNSPPFGPMKDWLRQTTAVSGYGPLPNTNPFVAYADAVTHYNQQLDNLSRNNGAVKRLHLIRHGQTRFNHSFGALNGQHLNDGQTDQLLQEILATQNPLALGGGQRRQFSQKIEQLAARSDAQLAPHTNEVRNLIGGYREMERAAAMLVTQDNPPPRA